MSTTSRRGAARGRHRAPLLGGRRALAFTLGGGGVFVVAGGAVAYAMLAATATGTTASASGTLELVLANNGVGFSQAVSNLAPGDVVNRFVSLTNAGTLDASGLTLSVTGTGSTLLTTDPTKGLAVSIASCSVAWTPATGVCPGTTTSLLSGTAVSALGSAASLVSGAVPAGAVRNVKVSLTLPDQVETVVNGSLPAGTIQGLATTLTYTFGQTQRAATTTNS